MSEMRLKEYPVWKNNLGKFHYYVINENPLMYRLENQSEHQYIGICLDEKKENWLLIPSSRKKIRSFLEREITVKDFVLESEDKVIYELKKDRLNVIEAKEYANEPLLEKKDYLDNTFLYQNPGPEHQEEMIRLIINKRDEQVLELLEKGFNPNTILNQGERKITILHLGIYYLKAKTILSILEKGVDPNLIGKEDQNPLLYSSVLTTSRKMTVIEKLIECGAEIDGRNQNGRTALMQCSYFANEYKKEIKLLLEKGADPRLRSKEGFTSLQLGFRNNSYIVKNLVNIFDGNSQFPLECDDQILVSIVKKDEKRVMTALKKCKEKGFPNDWLDRVLEMIKEV